MTYLKNSIRTVVKLVLAFSVIASIHGCAGKKADSDEISSDFPFYSGDSELDINIHDGRIPWAIGVHSYGVFRAFNHDTITHDKNGRGYQFNHHPNIVYWKGYYWVSYQGGPTDDVEGEHPRVPYWITYSSNGRNWEAPEILFPSIKFQGENTYLHTRMGFYVSTSGQLIAISFHGRHPAPNAGGENGIVRVGREIYGIQEDGRVEMGPVYALRYNEGRNKENTGIDHYDESEDSDFIDACNELLANKLVTQQWFEEDRRADLYTVNLMTNNEGPDASTEEKNEAKAFDWYTLPTGRIVGWWKGAAMAYSDNNWENTSNIHIDNSRFNEHRTAKMWGQKLSQDNYAMVYSVGTQTVNPATEWSWTRTPLVVTLSENGIEYKQDRAVVFGDVAPGRYINPPAAGGLADNRDGGPQYIRGISESNTGKPNTDGATGNLWLTYSVNKEDIWVSEVPVNIRSQATTFPKDDFESYSSNQMFGDWIVLSPAWAPVSLINESGAQFMRLQDKDPYDYAKVMRVFPANDKVQINFRFRPGQSEYGFMNIDVTDRNGRVACRFQIDESAKISIDHNSLLDSIYSYDTNQWISFKIDMDSDRMKYSISINDRVMADGVDFRENSGQVERLEFRTGHYRMNDYSRIGSWAHFPMESLPNPDHPLPLATFDIDDLEILPL